MALQEGAIVGNERYRIVRTLGAGGMATVWLAEEITFGNRPVAIKEARRDLPESDRATLRRRYGREILVCAELAKVKAPHVVPALTAERDGEDLLLVLEYMPGGDLAARLRGNQAGLPLAETLAIVRSVLTALQAAHRHPLEIIHRDVKPSNILFDAAGAAYLGDFGLALYTSSSQDLTKLLAEGAPLTPAYAAPEQKAGKVDLSPAADVYAVGCVLFEMLTGKRPGRVAPGTRPSSLRAGLPGWLDGVMAKALAEDPFQRYQDAGEMLAEVTAERAQAAPPALRPGVPTGAPSATPPSAPPRPPTAKPRSAWARFWHFLVDAPPPNDPATVVPGEKAADFRLAPERPAAASPATPPAARPPVEKTPARAVQVNPNVPPFSLRNDKQVRSLEDLVQEAQADPQALFWHLDKEPLKLWLETLGRADLVKTLAGFKQIEPGSGPRYLKQFLDATRLPHRYTIKPIFEFDWVLIPAGPFLMGSDPARDPQAQDDEKPQRRVDLPAFRISRTPVTVAQFHAFLAATGYRTQAELAKADDTWSKRKGASINLQQMARHPVTYVSHADALAFCRWADVRLPTGQEWEKAARGIDGRIYPWGDNAPDRQRCNFDSDSTTPVDKFPQGASPFGVLDMAGNVLEWTNGSIGGKWWFVRGGAYGYTGEAVRCASEASYSTDVFAPHIGFRVATSAVHS